MPLHNRMPAAIGVILPSSNRVVERVTHTMLSKLPAIDACFCRVPYAGHPPDGYDLDPFRRAAAMLAQAKPDIILWNATRGALLGFEPDRQLCAMIAAETGIAADTTALATVDLLRTRGLNRIGLLAQGTDADGRRLAQTFGQEGVNIVAGHNLGITDNFQAAQVPAGELEKLASALAGQGPLDAVLIWSTNLPGHTLTERLETRLGLPVFDSTTIGLWSALAHVERVKHPVYEARG